MCNMSRDDKDYQELLNRISTIDTNIGKLQFEMGSYKEDMAYVKDGMEKLVVYIERTRANDDKIKVLFHKVNEIEEHGTKNCPVNINRLDRLEKRLDKLDKYLITAILAVVAQLFILIVHLLDKHIPL